MGLGIYNISVALIGIMLSIAGIVLAIGYATDDRKLKEFGKSEIYQALINGMIISVLIAGFSGAGFFTLIINNIAGSASLGAHCNQFMRGNHAICFAYNYLVGLQPVTINNANYPTLMDASIGLLGPISVLYAGLSMLGSIQLRLGVISFGFNNMLTPILTALRYVIEALTASIISIEVQGILLQFIAIVAIPVLLPIGMVLRTVYITRRLGGAIMAVSIGLFAILPLTYVLNAVLSSTYLNSLSSTSVNTFILSETGANSNIINSITQTNWNANNSVGFIGYFAGSIKSLLQSFDNFLNQIIYVIALLVIEAFFLPAFSIILTAISIRELAKILGSEISFGKLYIF